MDEALARAVEISKREYSSRYVPSGGRFESLSLRQCRFLNCVVCPATDPSQGTVIQDVVLAGCRQRGCTIYGAQLKRIVVDDLTTQGLLDVRGCVFDGVVLRGRIGRILISASVADPKQQSEFDAWSLQFYKHVEVAVDISAGEFEELELHGIPARLVRRDPETQVVVTRRKAQSESWRQIDLGDWWPIALEMLAEGRYDDTVFVAPKRHKKFGELMEGLRKLREAGIAE